LQLLWELDNGRAIGLAGVPDVLLRSQLQHTLDLLGLKLTKVRTAAGQQASRPSVHQPSRVAAQLESSGAARTSVPFKMSTQAVSL
jgi:hypothetical protein